MLICKSNKNISHCLTFGIAGVSLLISQKLASAHHSHGGSTATYFNRSDSNPHLANGDIYGHAGPWFCAVDASHRKLLNHRIRVVNKSNGRSHIFLVADLGRFGRHNLDVSRGGSARLSGHDRPENFPVEWHDLGPAPCAHKKRRH